MRCAGCSRSGRSCCSSTPKSRHAGSAGTATGSSARPRASASVSTPPTAGSPSTSRSASRRSTARARRARSLRRCSTSFDNIPEQEEAKRLLRAALAQGADLAATRQGRAGSARASAGSGPAHAYLFHGPAGVGKRATALAFAAELLGGDPRVERRSHPDLYVLEPLGDQIRIDAVREMRRDLHMRPFEAQRRVYLVFAAHAMNDEAADALLKDLEEPPQYAVIARVAGGRLDRAERLLDEAAARRRAALLETARSVYGPDFDPAAAARSVLEAARERAAEAKEHEEAAIEQLDLPAREAEQRVRRATRGAEREQLLASLEELATWYRDLIAAAAGAESALVHVDRAEELREDGTLERLEGAERAAELVRETWRRFEEFQLSPGVALEALFVELRRAFAGAVGTPA